MITGMNQPSKELTAVPDAPGFVIVRHFLVDLSVESPYGRLPPDLLPSLVPSQGVAVIVREVTGVTDTYLVDVQLRLGASAQQQVAFVLELTYRIEVLLHQVAEEDRLEVLHVQVPDALAAAMQEIAETNSRFAGYPEAKIFELGFAHAYAERCKAGSL